jgi:hypothetical protein
MSDDLEKLASNAEDGAQRLCHLSIAYVDQLMNLMGVERSGSHGPEAASIINDCRDFLNMILCMRAELNLMQCLMVEAGIVTTEQVIGQLPEHYEIVTKAKCEQFNCEIDGVGLAYKNPPGAQRKGGRNGR